MKQFDAHRLIPADDLHWNEDEQKRVLLADEEIEAIVFACAKCGLEKLEDIMAVIRWAEQIRSGGIMLKGIIEGRLGVFASPEIEEPVIFPIEVLDEYRNDFEQTE